MFLACVCPSVCEIPLEISSFTQLKVVVSQCKNIPFDYFLELCHSKFDLSNSTGVLSAKCNLNIKSNSTHYEEIKHVSVPISK